MIVSCLLDRAVWTAGIFDPASAYAKEIDIAARLM
jgi:hypothetical protein